MSDPTIPVPMTLVAEVREALAHYERHHWCPSFGKRLLAAFDAAAAHPAEPERTIPWCDEHGFAAFVDSYGGLSCSQWRVSACRVTTRSVGGEVAT